MAFSQAPYDQAGIASFAYALGGPFKDAQNVARLHILPLSTDKALSISAVKERRAVRRVNFD